MIPPKTQTQGKLLLADVLKRVHNPRSSGFEGAICNVFLTSKKPQFVIEHLRENDGMSCSYRKPTYLGIKVSAEAVVSHVLKSLCQYRCPFDKRRWRMEMLRGFKRNGVTVGILADRSFQISEMQSQGPFYHAYTGRQWTVNANADVNRLFRLRGLGEQV